MAMEAVLREERAVVVEVDASFGMTETFQASDKDDSSDGHIFGEDEPMVEVQSRSTGASHDGVVILVGVVAGVQEVLHFSTVTEICQRGRNGSQRDVR